MDRDSGLEDILRERVRLGELFDVYAPLLTERQREICELLLGEDLSVAELGEALGMSRQGAYDLVRRSLERLGEIERSLGLLELKKAYESILSLIDENRNILPGKFLDGVPRSGDKMTWEGEQRGCLSR
jgi:predicted DNA-binding protein YlxM (UPF0122 family)